MPTHHITLWLALLVVITTGHNATQDNETAQPFPTVWQLSSMQEWDKVVAENRLVWIVLVHAGSECLMSRSAIPAFQHAAKTAMGVVGFASINNAEFPELVSRLDHKYQVKIKGFPTVLVVEPIRRSPIKHVSKYTGQVQSSALAKFALSRVQGDVDQITSKTLASFVAAQNIDLHPTAVPTHPTATRTLSLVCFHPLPQVPPLCRALASLVVGKARVGHVQRDPFTRKLFSCTEGSGVTIVAAWACLEISDLFVHPQKRMFNTCVSAGTGITVISDTPILFKQFLEAPFSLSGVLQWVEQMLLVNHNDECEQSWLHKMHEHAEL